MEKNNDTIIEKFVSIMEDGAYRDGLSFREVCRRLDIPENELNGLLYGTFGVRGEEIIRMFRNRIPLTMLYRPFP